MKFTATSWRACAQAGVRALNRVRRSLIGVRRGQCLEFDVAFCPRCTVVISPVVNEESYCAQGWSTLPACQPRRRALICGKAGIFDLGLAQARIGGVVPRRRIAAETGREAILFSQVPRRVLSSEVS
ncbi:MAG: hypothetical protein WCA20_11200 [Candidatus Sulfotelmatobacter sp.]